jgi:hypothetical protein
MSRSIFYSRRIVQKRARAAIFLRTVQALDLISLHSLSDALAEIGYG